MVFIRKRDPKKPTPPTPPEPEPTPPAPAPPAPQPTATIGAPTGIIGGPLVIAFGRGGPWSDVNRDDSYFLEFGAKHNVPPAMLKAMMVIESGGQMIWNLGGSGAFGTMQIRADIWGDRANALGYDLNTRRGQVGMAAAILGGAISGVRGNTPEERFLNEYYPTGGLDVPGEDGHTPRQYLADMRELMRQIDAAANETLPRPKPITGAELLALIAGPEAKISFGFNQPNINANGSPVNLYQYGVGHGTNAAHMHTGIDVAVLLYTPLRTPLAGVVRCLGNSGQGDWGQSCGSFADTITGGIGNVTVLTDAGLKLTFGHVNSSPLRLGQRVAAGDVVARSGGMVGPHLHLDVSINKAGTYWLLDPIPTILARLGGVIPTTYATPLPIPQPRDFTTSVTVTVLRDGVPVLQRADLNAPHLRAPLTKGETFEAVYQVTGDDKTIYWVSTRNSRVPLAGTKAVWGSPGSPNPVVCPPAPDLDGIIDELQDIDARLSHALVTLINLNS